MSNKNCDYMKKAFGGFSTRCAQRYCPVAILEKFVQLILYINWLRSSRRQVDVFRYRPFLRKIEALLENKGEQEKQK